jgi:hypothetical protein
MWHKWLWVDQNNVYHRHRGNCHAIFKYEPCRRLGKWAIYMLDPLNLHGQRRKFVDSPGTPFSIRFSTPIFFRITNPFPAWRWITYYWGWFWRQLLGKSSLATLGYVALVK